MSNPVDPDPASRRLTALPAVGVDAEPDVELLSRDHSAVILSDGQVLPITTMLDWEGEPCRRDDPEALRFVAGPSLSGQWHTGFVSDFVPRIVN